MKSGLTIAEGARRDLRRPRTGFANELKQIRRRIQVLEHRLSLLRIGPRRAGRNDISRTGIASAGRERTTIGSGNPRVFFPT